LHREAGRGGLVIAAVEAGGAADRAGLLVGDVLLSIADEPLDRAEVLLDALPRAGGAVSLRVMRGGKILLMNVSLAESGRAA
jgi:S1-C subfamily serine protease